MSNRKTSAEASAVAVAREMESGYALGSTLRFGDEKPPIFAQIVAASGVARYLTNAWVAASSLNATIVSPPPTTLAGESLTDGNGELVEAGRRACALVELVIDALHEVALEDHRAPSAGS